MSSLLMLDRVYRLEIESVLLVFSTQLCEPLTFCVVHLLSLPPSHSQRTLYTDSVWLGGVWGGGCWVVLETIFCRSLTLCIWPDSEPTLSPQTKTWEGRGPQTDKHLPQSLFPGKLFRYRYLTLRSISLIFLRPALKSRSWHFDEKCSGNHWGAL